MPLPGIHALIMGELLPPGFPTRTKAAENNDARALGYGEQGAGGAIPGGATLNFDVEVMGTAPAPPPPNLFKEIDANWDNLLSLPEVKAFFKGKGNPVRTQSLEHKREQCSLTEPEPLSLFSSVAADILRSRFPPSIRWYTI